MLASGFKNLNVFMNSHVNLLHGFYKLFSVFLLSEIHCLGEGRSLFIPCVCTVYIYSRIWTSFNSSYIMIKIQ